MQKKADEIQTFGHHLRELRRRLFWVAGVFLVGLVAGAVFNEKLIHIIQAPLGQTLYFTSPMGGLGFSMQICLLVGAIAAIPMAVYHLLKFIHPASGRVLPKSMVLILLVSMTLAAVGLTFAYFISLPNALKFLTHFGSRSIQALITTDEYLSFVLAYLGGSALIFQLPLLLLFINRIKPLGPSQLKKYQPHVIITCFIIAAILTPTPDPINQMVLALPMLILFELSCALVLFVNHRAKVRQSRVLARAKVRLVAPATSPGLSAAQVETARPNQAQPRPAAATQLAQVLDLSTVELNDPHQDQTPAPSMHLIDLRRPSHYHGDSVSGA